MKVQYQVSVVFKDGKITRSTIEPYGVRRNEALDGLVDMLKPTINLFVKDQLSDKNITGTARVLVTNRARPKVFEWVWRLVDVI